MAQELMHGWGGLRITCGVTWPPTDAVTGEQKKHKGSLSTGNTMPCPFYNFSGGLLVRCELPSSPNRSVKVKTVVSLSRLWSRWGPVPSGRGGGGSLFCPQKSPLCTGAEWRPALVRSAPPAKVSPSTSARRSLRQDMNSPRTSHPAPETAWGE